MRAVISPATKLDPTVARRVERILALGYTEARRRNAAGCHAEAVVDALLESTVAACDLHHLSTHTDCSNPQSFYLSHVELDIHGACISSLAPFDKDIAGILKMEQPVDLNEGMKLGLPIGRNCLTNPLTEFWKNAATELEISAQSNQESSLDPPDVSDDIAYEFFESLRHALDAVVQVDTKDTFTIRVVRATEPQQVVDGHRVPYALGYWLPATGLYRLPADVARDKFETLLKTTVRTPRIRQQSHTNVSTCLAGLVCQPTVRSRQFSFVGEYDFINELETRVWPHGDYAHIFMVPLSNHDFSPLPPHTVAHVYKGFPEDLEPDLEQLLLWRNRATLLFTERLRREYCHTVARHLATYLLAAIEDHQGLNRELAQLASIFCMPVVSTGVAASLPDSLAANLSQAVKAGVAIGIAERSQQWLHLIAPCGSRLKVDWPVGRPADVIAIQVWLARELDGRIREGHIQTELEREKDRIDQAVEHIKASTAAIENLLNQDPNAVKIYDRLAEMWRKEVFAGEHPHEEAKEITLLGHEFRQGHNICRHDDCIRCPDEEHKRVMFLFEPLAAERFVSHCRETAVDENERGAWAWLKRAAEAAGHGKINLACVVALLFGRFDIVLTCGIANFEHTVTLPSAWRSRWPSMLKNMALLATPKIERASSSVELQKVNQDLIFVVRGPTYEWFDKTLQAAKRSRDMDTRVGQERGDRLHHVAGAFGVVSLPIADRDAIDAQVFDGNCALRFTWKNVLDE
jgi:hypothetical protein